MSSTQPASNKASNNASGNTSSNTSGKAPSWRKARRPFFLKISFALILLGFAAGYVGGVNDVMSLMVLAFALWGSAGILALLVKS